jgi:hypothetical protein
MPRFSGAVPQPGEPGRFQVVVRGRSGSLDPGAAQGTRASGDGDGDGAGCRVRTDRRQGVPQRLRELHRADRALTALDTASIPVSEDPPSAKAFAKIPDTPEDIASWVGIPFGVAIHQASTA